LCCEKEGSEYSRRKYYFSYKKMDTKIIKKYLDSQKIKAVETYDFEKRKVSYSPLIKQNREIKSFS